MKPPIRSRSLSRAITLIEACVVIAMVALLLALLLPALAKGGSNQRIRCVNNLKQVGIAYLVWAYDHNEPFPFSSTNIAGSLQFANSPEVFHHFQAISNELVTPKILVCSTDRERVPATDFVTLSNANLSYFAGLDARESDAQSLLSGDRNITGGTLSNGFLRLLKPKTAAGWAPGMHVKGGNIGLGDGSVLQLTESLLRQQLKSNSLSVIRLAIP